MRGLHSRIISMSCPPRFEQQSCFLRIDVGHVFILWIWRMKLDKFWSCREDICIVPDSAGRDGPSHDPEQRRRGAHQSPTIQSRWNKHSFYNRLCRSVSWTYLPAFFFPTLRRDICRETWWVWAYKSHPQFLRGWNTILGPTSPLEIEHLWRRQHSWLWLWGCEVSEGCCRCPKSFLFWLR